MNQAPSLAVVTPSYNQGTFLEEAIRSVLDQGYEPLQYAVIDGGSSDDSSAIIDRYSDRLAFHVSEPDGGQYDAINKGFQRVEGEVMAWLNSDDLYTPWAFSVVGELFARFPQIEWLTTRHPLRWDRRSRAVGLFSVDGYSRNGFRKGQNLVGAGWFARGFIQQESTFWRRSLWERAGGYVDSSLDYAADFELWLRFFDHAELYTADTPLGGFREHGDQKTARAFGRYLAEAEQVLRRSGGSPPGRLESRLRRFERFLPRRLLRRLSAVDEVKVCVYRPQLADWEIIAH
jgi:glycosyltransferase involved in cell wall biosynthesis